MSGARQRLEEGLREWAASSDVRELVGAVAGFVAARLGARGDMGDARLAHAGGACDGAAGVSLGEGLDDELIAGDPGVSDSFV